MIYLTGSRNKEIEPYIVAGTVGLLNTPKSSYRIDENVLVWAMDNGCFTNTYPGNDIYLEKLAKYSKFSSTCLFAAAPDVVGDAVETLKLSKPMFKRIRALGYPVALVAQDGMENLKLPWKEFDWLFVGGSTEWKLGDDCAELITKAKSMGKKVHIGRVNSKKRFVKFARLGCDTADGTFLAFGPKVNLPKMLSWYTAAELDKSQIELW